MTAKNIFKLWLTTATGVVGIAQDINPAYAYRLRAASELIAAGSDNEYPNG